MQTYGSWKRVVPIGLVLFCGGASAAAPAPAPMSWTVVSPLTQVFPVGSLAGENVARLEAARGEWEPFQIVVRGPLANVRAEAAPLSGPGGARLLAPRLYRVGYVQVTVPSSVEGHPGRWPDPLIPDVDAFAGERRNAFPFAVPKGEVRAIWVELFVPHEARPGDYHGAITLRADERAPAEVPIALVVHRFELPRSSSIPVTFGFNARALPLVHPHLRPGDEAALAKRYALMALRHRVSLHGGSMEPAAWTVSPGGRVRVDFRAYDAEVGPFLDGTADPDGPADGARFSAIDLRLPAKLSGALLADYARQMIAHLRARGWLSRVFDYTFDEPPPERFGEVRARAEALRAIAPEVPRLVTTALTPALAGAVDIWCPVVNWVDDKPSEPRHPGRAAYAEKGARIWWYQACASHGCDIVGGDYFTGWPSLVIDAPAVSHRILEWLTYRYQIGGELYYNTDEAYARGLDPFRDQRLHGGNGDGTLFYPGSPDRIGGKTPIPVGSIRLALVREGLEDYEYLALHEARFGRAQTVAIAASIAPRTFEWQHDGTRLYAARHQLAVDLDRAAVTAARHP